MVDLKEEARRIKYESDQNKHLADKQVGLISANEFKKRHEQAWVTYLEDKWVNGESDPLFDYIWGKTNGTQNYEKDRDEYWKNPKDEILHQEKRRIHAWGVDELLLKRGYITEIKMVQEKQELLDSVWLLEQKHYRDEEITFEVMCSEQTILYFSYWDKLKKSYEI